MSALRIVPCLCGCMPNRHFDYNAQDFLLICVDKNCKHRFYSRSGNEALAIFYWRRLVTLGREHEEAKIRNLEKLVLVCDNACPNTNGNNTAQLDAHAFLEHSLQPDPESGFGVRANSDSDPRRADFGSVKVNEDLRQFLSVSGETSPIGIPAPRNSLVAFTRQIGGHASGGGGPC